MRPRSLTVPDARGGGATLRITSHPEQGKVVVSHWRDDLCVASTPVELGELAALIGVLADALGDAVHGSRARTVATSPALRFTDRVRRWLRPRLAQIVELRSPFAAPRDEETRRDGGLADSP